MLTRASDYSHADVSEITVAGKIMPARDVANDGSWRVLKAEDVACLIEMMIERWGNVSAQGAIGSIYGIYGVILVEWKPGIVLKWGLYIKYLSLFLRMAFDESENSIHFSRVDYGWVVNKDYEFEEVDGAQGNDPRQWYPEAFEEEPSMEYYRGDEAKRFVLDADYIRCMFYDMARIVRFYVVAQGRMDGRYLERYRMMDYLEDGSGDRDETKTINSKPYWGLSMYAYGSTWYQEYFTSIDTAECKEVDVDICVWKDYIEEMIAFVELDIIVEVVETESEASTAQWYQDHPYAGPGAHEPSTSRSFEYKDVIPVECEKDASGKWNVKAGFFSDNVAMDALRRHGFDPTRQVLRRMPEDTYEMSHKRVSFEVRWYMSKVVCKCKFPSDFSNLNWSWEPQQSKTPKTRIPNL